ncbi:MAG: fructose bisphosphate aldolase [Proteobacteria bacterium]|nr:fructose bisphosphate aldolase [Pseudomonadota bacterium]MBT5064707.1 fructose bisphosphate aldolase [Pseudomonadota bacterium]MBT6192872.1 fructose bisphosphate aldolase [Pseudomonadota bacterium]MBT6465094.1 fructose bisphosphate aldolase [Pseudomonadota bacterium]MBT6673912.1 fructose bisphosphate aldolase [Pseudomonadota bacterium]
MFEQQLEKIKTQNGFIAALDQSGGSTPKTLKIYGISDDSWSGEQEMFATVHKMRSRIIRSPAFSGKHILAAILFENTMDRDIGNKTTAEYLWEEKNVIPILKIDQGLADEINGSQKMKPMPNLDILLTKAKSKGIFGTKMRSLIKTDAADAIKQVVAQQFEVAKQIIAAGLVPIIEPEVDITSSSKSNIEIILKTEILRELDALSAEQHVMLKLTLPEEDNFYSELTKHSNVVRVVALSGGYPREEANKRLSNNFGVIASFNRALTEGLYAQQGEQEFNQLIQQSVESIFEASKT